MKNIEFNPEDTKAQSSELIQKAIENLIRQRENIPADQELPSNLQESADESVKRLTEKVDKYNKENPL